MGESSSKSGAADSEHGTTLVEKMKCSDSLQQESSVPSKSNINHSSCSNMLWAPHIFDGGHQQCPLQLVSGTGPGLSCARRLKVAQVASFSLTTFSGRFISTSAGRLVPWGSGNVLGHVAPPRTSGSVSKAWPHDPPWTCDGRSLWRGWDPGPWPLPALGEEATRRVKGRTVIGLANNEVRKLLHADAA